MWQTAFGSRTIVGQTVEVNGLAREVIGIMPPGVDVMDNRTEIWMPLGLNPGFRQNRGSHFLYLIGRLKDGVTPQQAQTELAAIGTYGVLSYMVAERRREIGIRMALGAAQRSVLAQVMRQGIVLTAVGIVIGLAGAFTMNRLIASLLFGVRPTDPRTMVGVVATITLVAAVACWLPAWRASRVDPNVVLRQE